MKTYLVGGAVRDALLGRPVHDRDWVVVGAAPEQLVAQGFVPVGKDFPVFLHPHTHEEVALARTERKTGPGYTGFAVHAAPNVTLEQDLARRDLTINAIAVRAHATEEAQSPDGAADSTPQLHLSTAPQDWISQGLLVDPYGGQRDIASRTLRHVTEAFREDPVRILRVARFAARYTDFSVAPETLQLMQDMVRMGEVDHLVSERVWQELAKGLMESRPSRIFEVLRACGALARLLPELDRLWGIPQPPAHHPEIDTGVHVMMVLDRSAELNAPLAVRFACLGHDLGKGTTPVDRLPRHIGHEVRSLNLLRALCPRLRVPSECAELAQLVAQEHGNIHRSLSLNAAGLVRLLERCDAFRKPERFAQALLACQCDAQGRLHHQNTPYPQADQLTLALQLAQAVATKSIAEEAIAKGASGPHIGKAIHSARIQAVAAGLPTVG